MNRYMTRTYNEYHLLCADILICDTWIPGFSRSSCNCLCLLPCFEAVVLCSSTHLLIQLKSCNTNQLSNLVFENGIVLLNGDFQAAKRSERKASLAFVAPFKLLTSPHPKRLAAKDYLTGEMSLIELWGSGSDKSRREL